MAFTSTQRNRTNISDQALGSTITKSVDVHDLFCSILFGAIERIYESRILHILVQGSQGMKLLDNKNYHDEIEDVGRWNSQDVTSASSYPILSQTCDTLCEWPSGRHSEGD